MKKMGLIMVIGLVIFLVSSAGCAEFMTGNPRVTSSTPQTVSQVQAEPWKGLKVRVAVIEFENKSGVHAETTRTGTTIQVVTPAGGEEKKETVRDPIGSGMKEQLITALSQTGAFILIERAALNDVLKEQELAKNGNVRKETGAGSGELEGAEFLIYGAVTEYQPSQASAAMGAGYGALPVPSDPTVGSGNVFVQVLARIAGGLFGKQDHVAIDLRLVDARTGRIVNATSVEAQPRDLGGAFGGTFGEFLVGFGVQHQTPIQKAVRACMIKAVNWIADNTLRVRPVETAPAATPSQASASAPTAPLTSGEIRVSVNSAALIRSGADSRSGIVEKVSKDSQLTLLDETKDWFKVRTSNGKEGWILKEMTK